MIISQLDVEGVAFVEVVKRNLSVVNLLFWKLQHGNP